MQRNFTVHSSSIDVVGGRYSALTPIAAAQNAADKFFEKHKNLRKIAICMRETTKTSNKKTYEYNAYRKGRNGEYQINVLPVEKKSPIHRKLSGGNGRNFVLITDIGRDIDDTLALVVLLHKHKIGELNLKAIVVAGYNIKQREKLVYYWLYKFGIHNLPDDRKIPVFVTPGDYYKDEKCVEPEGLHEALQMFNVKNYIEATYGRLETIYDNIRSPSVMSTNKRKLSPSNTMMKKQKHGTDTFGMNYDTNSIFTAFIHSVDNIEILCIANITWVNYLIQNNILNDGNFSKIRRLYMQGVYYMKNGEMEPLDYNLLALDGDSSRNVFSVLKDKIPFYFLGKYAAYLIKFHEPEFNRFDEAFGIKLKQQGLEMLANFYIYNTPVFSAVYKQDIPDTSKLELLTTFNNGNKEALEAEKAITKNHLNEYLGNMNDPDYMNALNTGIKHNKIYTFLQNVEKISNAYDLILVYLALNENKFNFNYGLKTYKAAYNMEINGQKVTEIDIPFEMKVGNITHYQFNISDPNIFKQESMSVMENVAAFLGSRVNGKQLVENVKEDLVRMVEDSARSLDSSSMVVGGKRVRASRRTK